MNAAAFSVHRGYPINTFTTINAAHMQRIGSGGVFEIGHLWDGFRDLVQLMRKWTKGRGLEWAAIWARESIFGKSVHPGEHWHIGHHLPKQHHRDFLMQLAIWTGEELGQDLSGRGTVGRSMSCAWHVGTRTKRGVGPTGIAAYIGKAEPNKIRRYGKWVKNPDKVDHSVYGGDGWIEGKRIGISQFLSPEKQLRAGFTGPYQATGHHRAAKAQAAP